MATVTKYISDILTSKKETDKTDPSNPVDYYEIVVSFTDARNVWLNLSTPDVKNNENVTQVQVLIKDNKTKKLLTMIGAAQVPAGFVLPVFNNFLINDKTIIFRGAHPISVWYESKIDE